MVKELEKGYLATIAGLNGHRLRGKYAYIQENVDEHFVAFLCSKLLPLITSKTTDMIALESFNN